MTLEELSDSIWQQLEQAVIDPEHPWRTPVLGTVSSRGQVPALRTVVIRNVSRDQSEFLFHTDRRSRKVDDMVVSSNVSLAFYNPDERIQLLAEGTADVLTEGTLFDEEWHHAAAASKRSFLAPIAPGTATAQPCINFPDEFRERLPNDAESEPGRLNFAVIVVRVIQFDWLQLDRTGNTRARLVEEKGKWSAGWLAP